MWYEKLGFENNPLDVRSNPNLIGVSDVEDTLLSYIKQGQICMLYGFTGSGKTSMLERLQNRSDLEDYKFIFLSGDRLKPEHDIEKDLDSGRSFFEKLLRKKPRNYVVLLDESHEISRYVTETVKGLWNAKDDNDFGIHSVVICQIEDNIGTNFSGSFKDRMGNKVLRMRKLTSEELKEVLTQRLTVNDKDYSDSFNGEALDLIITSSGGSVRALLDIIGHIFMYLDKFEENPIFKDEKLNKNQIFNILSTMGIKLVDEEVSPYDDLLSSERFNEAIATIKTLGAFDTLSLAKAMDTKISNARNIIHTLRKNKAIIFSHKDKKHKFWVLAPRLRHEVVDS